jgi:hypothetical protein
MQETVLRLPRGPRVRLPPPSGAARATAATMAIPSERHSHRTDPVRDESARERLALLRRDGRLRVLGILLLLFVFALPSPSAASVVNLACVFSDLDICPEASVTFACITPSVIISYCLLVFFMVIAVSSAKWATSYGKRCLCRQ